MAQTILFFTEDTTYQLKHKNKIREWILLTARKESRSLQSLNVILCSDSFLYQLNVDYLNHSTLTDVITFDYNEDKQVNGEIYISIDRIRDNAKMHYVSVQNELHRVIIHGFLHLCGYADKSPDEKRQMTVKEDYYLSLRNF